MAPNASQPLTLAVVTGGHTFDVRAFQHVFEAMENVDFYVQSMDDFTSAPDAAAQYDVVLFYNMHGFKPGQELPWYQRNIFSTLENLGTTKQGIVVLHHALLAFKEWPLWSELVGIEARTFGYHHGDPVTAHVAAQHPITEGLESWTMPDETYTMADAGAGNEILLTTDHAQSMKTLGWTRQFRQSRVFCYQPGHDARAFNDANFRRVVERGVKWTANRL